MESTYPFNLCLNLLAFFRCRDSWSLDCPTATPVEMTPPDDPQLLELLDDYLSQLQAGKRPDREALLREHPELAASLKCLEALEGLAPAVSTDLDVDTPDIREPGPAPGFRPLRALGRSRPGRHGRGLQGAAKGPRPHRGRQDDPGHAPGIAGTHPPLPGRGLGRRPLAAFEHHPDPRCRPAPRPALLHDGIHRRREPGPADCTAAALLRRDRAAA